MQSTNSRKKKSELSPYIKKNVSFAQDRPGGMTGHPGAHIILEKEDMDPDRGQDPDPDPDQGRDTTQTEKVAIKGSK
jgi:hypothetical protein